MDLANALSGILHRPIHLQLTARLKAQQMVANQQADVFPISERRIKSIDFSDKILTAGYSLFPREGMTGIACLDDLEGNTAGVIPGGFPEDLLHLYPRLILKRVSTDPGAFRLLKEGAVDAYSVKKATAAVLAEISRGLRLLREDGEIARIQNQWMPVKMIDTTQEEYRRRLLQITLIPLTVLLAFLAAWIFLLKRQINRRKATEKALIESEIRYRQLFEQTSKCVVVYRPVEGGENFVVADINHAVEETEEVSRSEATGRGVLDVFPRLSSMGVIEVMRRVARTGVSASYPVTIRKSGRLLTWCDYYIYKLPSGEIVTLYEYLTERKKIEEELKQSQEKFAKAFQNAPVLFAIVEADTGIHVDINDEAVQAVGLKREEIIGFTPVDIGWLSPKEWERLRDDLLSKGRISGMEIVFHAHDGRAITGLLGGERLLISGRDYLMFIAVDITARKTAELRQEMSTRILALLSSEKDIRTLVRDTIILIQNYTTFEAVGIRLQEGEDYPYFETSGFDRAFVEREKYLCARDDQDRPIRDPGGKVLLECMCGNVLQGRIDPAYPFFTAGGSFWTNSTSELLASTTEADRQARTRNRCNGEGYESVALIPLKAGDGPVGLLQLNDRRKGLFTLDFIRHLEGIGISIGGAIQRIRAEDALAEAEHRLQLTFDHASVGICFIGWDGRILRVNREMTNMLGYDRAELEGKSIDDVIHPDDREFSPAAFRDTFPDRDVQPVTEIRYLCKEGQVAYCRASSSVIRDAKGHPLYILSHVQDMTQQRQMAQRLERAERMEALGLLAGGVAHDLNNIIGIALGYSEMLLDDLDARSPLREPVDRIIQATQRASAVVQDMLTMTRRNVAAIKVLNLNAVIGEYLESPELSLLLARHPGVEIQTALSSDLLNIKGSGIHLTKAIMNLVSNAAEAIHDGGIVTVTTRNIHMDRAVKGYDAFREGDYVVVCVSDTGEGISAENLPHIFEPFYTKKVMGKSGTGLGLAVVWGVVKDHNGYIDVESSPKRGTTFSLYFPVCREEISPTPKAIDRGAYLGRGETILVVDDNPQQRDLAVRLLSKLQYLPASVSSGEEAVEFLKKTPVDLMLLDMIMDPGIDGLETYRRVVAFRPRQKAVIVSGFAETDRVAEAQRLGAGAYVKKPYLLETLGMAIRQELDRERESPGGYFHPDEI